MTPEDEKLDDANQLAARCLREAHEFVNEYMGPQTPAERIQREATFAMIMAKAMLK